MELHTHRQGPLRETGPEAFSIRGSSRAPARVLSLVLWTACLASSVLGQERALRIGFALDGPSEGDRAILEIFEAELRRLLGQDYAIWIADDLTLVGDHTLGAAGRNLESLLSEPSIDLVITLGPLTSIAAARRDVLPKLVLAPFMPDPQLSGAPLHDGTSGVSNLNYLTAPAALDRELETFREIVPFHKLGFLAGRGLLDALPRAPEKLQAMVRGLDVEIVPVPVAGSATRVLSSIPSDVDAVYIADLGELGADDLVELLTDLKKRKLASFSRRGRTDVKHGALASLTPQDWLKRLARRTALNVQDLLLGREASALPVAIVRRDELVINLATARATGARPSFRILSDATVLNEDTEPVSRELSLADVLAEAVSVNRDLTRKNFEVQAGEENVVQARSGLRPQISLSATGSVIDQDRARVLTTSERTLTGSVAVTQALWSDSAWANLSIQKSLQTGRVYDRERVRLDVALEAATAYLGVLRAKSFVAILTGNLRTSRKNLELAEVRVAIGSGDRSEVFRWKSQIASDKSALVTARAERDNLKAQLNRLLHRPLAEDFSTEETDLSDPALPYDPRGQRFLRDPWTFDLFRRFMMREALEASPELGQLDANIEAQRRALKAAKRSYFSPDVFLTGQVAHRGVEGGVGSDFEDSPFDIDRTDWSLGVVATLPLFTSGFRSAEVQKTQAELWALGAEREALVERLEQRVYAALNVAAASHAGIELAEEAAQAAQDSLSLVTDAYRQGTRSIVSLLDAQNAALSAGLGVADSTFNFMIDLMEVERAIGRFTFYLQPEEREAWFSAAEDFIERESHDEK